MNNYGMDFLSSLCVSKPIFFLLMPTADYRFPKIVIFIFWCLVLHCFQIIYPLSSSLRNWILCPSVSMNISKIWTCVQVIEDDIDAGELCSRREYARWLVRMYSSLER